jgi:hypothetical protein
LQCSVIFLHGLKKNAPHKNNVTRWYRQFVETGCLCKGRSPGRPLVSDDNIERVCETFQRRPCKSVARAAGNWACQKWWCGKCCISGCVLNRARYNWCRPLYQLTKWKGMNFARRCNWKWRKMVS